MIRVPYGASLYDLDAFLDNLTPYYHLFTTAMPEDPLIVLADFTEADWPAYAPQRASGWTPAVLVGERAASMADALLWTRGTGGAPRDVYGYYVTDTAGGPLIWWEAREEGPLPMQDPFHTVRVLPRLTLREDPDSES